MNDAPKGKRRARSTALRIIAVIGTTIAVVAVATFWGPLTGTRTDTEVVRTPPPTTATTSVPQGIVQLHEPFANTPASGWKNGMEGISLPKAKAVDEFSAAEVTAAFDALSKHIEARYLDRRVIEQHDFAPFLATLAKDSAADIEPDLDDTVSAFGYLTLIHPDYPLLPAEPKTNGSFAVSTGEPGELVITGRLAVAYAFDTEHPQRHFDPLDIVTVYRAELTFYFTTGPGWEASARGLWIGETEALIYSMNCEEIDNGYLAPHYSDRQWGGPEPGHSDEYLFDPDEPLEIEDSCA